MCVCAFIAYFQPQQRRAIFQFYLISRLISNNGTARHPQWTNAGMAATENIVAPFVKHCRRNYRCNLHAPLNWSLLSPPRWFIPPSSFRFTLLSFSSHPHPPPFFFFIFHFSTFSSQRKCLYIFISKSRQRDTQRVEAYFQKERDKKEEGKMSILLRYCERSVTSNGDISKRFTGKGKKKKGRRGEWTGMGGLGWNNAIWIYDRKKDAWSEDRDRKYWK